MGSVAEREWTLRRVDELAGKSSEYFQAKNQIENLYDQMIQRQNEDCSWLQGRKQLRVKIIYQATVVQAMDSAVN